VIVQVAVVALVVALLWYLFSNLRRNLPNTSYGFLDQPFGVDIPGSDFRPSQSVRDALLVGYVNTIRVAGLGIVAATVLGVLVGVGRLSKNLLVRTSSTLYVEVFRNVPVFVWIYLAFFVVVATTLPPITEALEPLGAAIISNRGIFVPFTTYEANGVAFVVACGIGILLAAVVWVVRTRRFDATGAPHHRVLLSSAAFLAAAAVGYFVADRPIAVTVPERDGLLVTGGLNVNASYAALLVALVLYTASHIAEITRGSIQAVHKGQTEAAEALGLSAFQRLRFVILPQALRIAIPPLANQYLNLTKNSSLAVAVGYVEITRVTQSVIGNAAPAAGSRSAAAGRR
jgi:general L-amino acid transport system permease protein